MASHNSHRELVWSAVERGYFKVPRQTTLQTLADEHGISDVEASERLRNGLDAVLRESFDEPADRSKREPETNGRRQ